MALNRNQILDLFAEREQVDRKLKRAGDTLQDQIRAIQAQADADIAQARVDAETANDTDKQRLRAIEKDLKDNA